MNYISKERIDNLLSSGLAAKSNRNVCDAGIETKITSFSSIVVVVVVVRTNEPGPKSTWRAKFCSFFRRSVGSGSSLSLDAAKNRALVNALSGTCAR